MAEIKTAQQAVLVGIVRKSEKVPVCERSLDELSRLLHTAGGEEFARVIQQRPAIDPATVIGSGKVAEIAELCRANGIGLVVFDMELSPSQIRNLEKGMEDVMVIDRSMLILDIFALHAVTGEGKLQVELALLRYTAPRLTGHGKELSRLGGTIGTRGPGESKLEEDRRHIQRRIRALEDQLDEMAKNRATIRAARERSGIPKVAIVGYTNAGKSTLLNYLTGAGVLSEDKLFATLDPTTRKLTLPEGEEVLLTDTVGLIRKLPHHLIEAFHSTLEEAALADVLLIVADLSDPECAEQLEVTRQTLHDLGADGKPTIIVYNKCDTASAAYSGERPVREGEAYISAATGAGVDGLLSLLLATVREGKRKYTLHIPYAKSGEVNGLYAIGTVAKVEYTNDYIEAEVILDRKGAGMVRAYLTEAIPEETEDEE